ncbi:hypothetical protein OEG84_11315 [Hoeflea sp. G2-23]|uniref:Uncharacterized protein n=1 Tax=Hoeflea algicola TaxID=2983763 RepID=A0ABT3Z917_9HYPH|nr:hypothetical protein [Hoeflea algicola]MCY0148282.1 hypothetical protein [Hoeflea algicola]
MKRVSPELELVRLWHDLMENSKWRPFSLRSRSSSVLGSCEGLHSGSSAWSIRRVIAGLQGDPPYQDQRVWSFQRTLPKGAANGAVTAKGRESAMLRINVARIDAVRLFTVVMLLFFGFGILR